MDQMVRVSLLHPMTLRVEGEEFRYAPGLRQMPHSHARALGLLHRIRRQGAVADRAAPAVGEGALESVFDTKLVEVLQGAGYRNLAELAAANPDQLRAVEGIGPARFEQIQAALGRHAPDEGEEDDLAKGNI